MATYAPGTGGVQAPSSSAAPNTNQGSGSVPQNKRRKQKRRVVNGQVQYQWPNGTWHSRKFGKRFRSNAGKGGGGGGGGTGGAQAPAKPPSKHPLLDQANALADIRYGEAQRSLDLRGQAIAPWYQNYMNEITADQDRSRAYNAGLQAGAQQRATAAGQVAPGIDPNSEAGKDAALAAAARQALGEGLLTTLQGIGGVQENYLAGRKAVAATSQLGEESRLAQDRTALAKERGAFVASTREDLRAKKRQERLENAAFGLKAADQSNQLNKYGYTTEEWNSFSDAKRNRIRNKGPKTQGPDLGKVNKYGITERKWRNMSQAERQKVINDFEESGGKPKGEDKFTPTQRHKTKADIRKGIAAVKAQIDPSNTLYTSKGFWQRAYKALIGEKGYDPLLARAIIQRMRKGRLDPKVAKKLKANYGITLGSGKRIELPKGSVETVAENLPL